MKHLSLALFSILLLLSSCNQVPVRVTEDFNFDWKFYLGETSGAEEPSFDDSQWFDIRLPHDWSIRESYQKENTSASTGFVVGGIGWYRKSFTLPASDKGKHIRIEFDGIYCNSEVWINGHYLGFRPNGYISFSYELSDYLNYGDGFNIITVKADHSAYADTRWYAGSGIYRNVRLVKTSPVFIPQWGVQIATSDISEGSAIVNVKTMVEGSADPDIHVAVKITGPGGNIISRGTELNTTKAGLFENDIRIKNPALWGVEEPNLYKANITVEKDGKIVDEISSSFGIRFFEFDADKGFFLNGEWMKIKGVNIHHDAGALGSAVPKAIWEYRVNKLKSMGTNAIRMSHNPHSPELMEVCDEMGMLVMDEFFDEWFIPKDKDVLYKGDGAAGEEISRSYSSYFWEWAERDLKDLIRRDFNHPCVIMYSIGNEIEWTFPLYSETFDRVNEEYGEHNDVPIFDTSLIKPIFTELTKGIDSLSITAHLLYKWVKEMDTSRPVTCGSVRPSIGIAGGFSEAVDLMGFNYGAARYDEAHKKFPNLKIIGSENQGSYSEWKSINDREFVSGIFVWTGFAYLGEAGPWPRKGLEISFFDFAGYKTPRGHFYECLWKQNPKVYMVTTPAKDSEYSYTKNEGWKFEMQYTKPPVWSRLRLWEWYNVNEHWNYQAGEEIIVQVYTNCREAELFLNEVSLGKKLLSDFSDDNIIKWMIPFSKGTLKVKAYHENGVVKEYKLNSNGKIDKIELLANRASLKADNYDVALVKVKLFDEGGLEIRNVDTEITFKVEGVAKLLALDNGWEKNVESHYKNSIKTHNGRARAYIQASDQAGEVHISASIGDKYSQTIKLKVKK